MKISFPCPRCDKGFSKPQGLHDHLRFKHNASYAREEARAVPPVCPYCNTISILVSGDIVYAGRKDLAEKRFYRCEPCAAWVGCHPGTLKPLGRLANADLRAAKQRAHAAFDPLWRLKITRDDVKQGVARSLGYQWLAEHLGIPEIDCHIGMFDIETCERVVEVCSPYIRRAA